MAEETAQPSVKKTTAKKMGKPNKWIIGLLLLVLVLGGFTIYQLKKNKELTDKQKQLQDAQTNRKGDIANIKATKNSLDTQKQLTSEDNIKDLDNNIDPT